ncbi:hypothetical protein AB0I68_11680 [Streptomyces sp. NPDC050448]|uniref:hypothetical protein n=1 Tax=Streptomyces sp. NPDC050448 TaxID=3155404 RepID=UPI003414D076
MFGDAASRLRVSRNRGFLPRRRAGGPPSAGRPRRLFGPGLATFAPAAGAWTSRSVPVAAHDHPYYLPGPGADGGGALFGG